MSAISCLPVKIWLSLFRFDIEGCCKGEFSTIKIFYIPLGSFLCLFIKNGISCGLGAQTGAYFSHRGGT